VLNRTPTEAQLRWFGLVITAFFGIVGGMVLWQAESLRAAGVVWGVGAGLAALYCSAPPLRRGIYLAWMAAFSPIAWAISSLALVVVYYGVIAPVALSMRLVGRDRLARSYDASSDSYWVARRQSEDNADYFRQS
jgi:hypothetical protein